MTLERRLRRYLIHRSVFEGLLSGRARVKARAWPEDAEIVSLAHDADMDAFSCVVRSDAFDPLHADLRPPLTPCPDTEAVT